MKRFPLLLACLISFICVTASAQTTDPLHQFNTAVRKLVSQVTPSVVQVIATGYGPVESNGGNNTALVGMQQKIGSGVIIDPEGYIVTNAHVIGGAQHVRVSVPTVVRSALTHTSANSPVVLQIERSGKLLFIAFKLEQN